VPLSGLCSQEHNSWTRAWSSISTSASPGIELLTIDARIVIASVDTYLRRGALMELPIICVDLEWLGDWNPLCCVITGQQQVAKLDPVIAQLGHLTAHVRDCESAVVFGVDIELTGSHEVALQFAPKLF
jgi:hypothetical protein